MKKSSRYVVKKTLHQAHALIADAQDFFSTDLEGLVDVVLYDDEESAENIAKINAELEKLHRAIDRFDNAFHDLFDCR